MLKVLKSKVMFDLALFTIYNNTIHCIFEGVHGIRPKVTFDVMSNSPCVSQGNISQFARRI